MNTEVFSYTCFINTLVVLIKVGGNFFRGVNSMKLVLSLFSVSLFEDSQFSIFLTAALAVLFKFCKSLSLIIRTVSLANNRTLNSAIIRAIFFHLKKYIFDFILVKF